MQLFLVFILAIAVTFIPQSTFSAPATTIDELAAMYKIEGCVDCHEQIHDEWKDSWHGKSLVDSRVIRTWRTFIVSGLDKKGIPRKELKNICLICHAPQVKDATDEVSGEIANLIVTAADDKDAAKREAAVKELSKININCFICHNMKATPDGNPKAGALYGPKGTPDPKEPPHEEFETIKSDFMKTSKFCASCHHGCPPGMPSTLCPTLWTSYQEDYIRRGGNKACQDCHMQGTDYKMHKFPGVEDVEFAKTGIDLVLHAAPTEFAYHLENKIVPSVIVNVQVKNTSGHGIPHGCVYVPTAALDVTVKDQNGKIVFTKSKDYWVNDFYVKAMDPKNEPIMLSVWEFDRQVHVHEGIEPGEVDSNTFIIPLTEGTKSVDVEASFRFIYEKGKEATWNKVNKKIEF